MIYALMADGFEEIEALAFIDILRRAELEIKTVSITDSNLVTGAHNIPVICDITISELKDDYTMIFLPGGYPGYVNLGDCDKVIKLLHKAADEKKRIAAICAAPSVLGREGLLDGHKACCFPSFEKELLGAEVSFDDVVVSGNIITSRGAGTAHKLAFEVVKLYKGEETATKLSETMIYTGK